MMDAPAGYDFEKEGGYAVLVSGGQQLMAFQGQSPMETIKICKLGFNQDHYTFALILLMKIVLCSKCYRIKLIDYKCFHMKSS